MTNIKQFKGFSKINLSTWNALDLNEKIDKMWFVQDQKDETNDENKCQVFFGDKCYGEYDPTTVYYTNGNIILKQNKGIASKPENIGETFANSLVLGNGVSNGTNTLLIGYGKIENCNSFLGVGNIEGNANYGGGFGYLHTIEGDGAQLAMGGIGGSSLGGFYYGVESCSGNKVVIDTEPSPSIVGANIRFLYNGRGVSKSCSPSMKILFVDGNELTIDGTAPPLDSIWGISLFRSGAFSNGYGQTVSGLGSISLGPYAMALGVYARATGEGSMALLKNPWAKHKNTLVIGEIESTDDDGIYLGVPIKSGMQIINNGKEIIFPRGGNTLAQFKTNSVYGGFVEYHIDGDSSGAGGGFRFYHKNQIRLQVLTGNPDYAFSEGTTFDVLDGNLGFSVRKADGLIKFTNTPSKGANAPITFDVGKKQLQIGEYNPNNKSALTIDAIGHSQLTLKKQYTPTGSDDTIGEVGSMAWDDNYYYVKTTTGWKRTILESF